MTNSLEDALSDACTRIVDTAGLVRVVLSGCRRNMVTEFDRIDIRPVEIKGKVLLQLSHNDGRATTVKNLIPERDDVLALLSSGYSNILVDSIDGSMSIRVTKSGDAQQHFEKKSMEPNDKLVF